MKREKAIGKKEQKMFNKAMALYCLSRRTKKYYEVFEIEVDNNVVEYKMYFFSGYAFGELKDKRHKKAPYYILMQYKNWEKLTKRDKDKCREYRGLPYDEEITFSDVCMCMGKLVATYSKEEIGSVTKGASLDELLQRAIFS